MFVSHASIICFLWADVNRLSFITTSRRLLAFVYDTIQYANI